MEIRKLKDKDIPKVVDLWYNTSIVAHSFISAEYWKEHRELMAMEYLPNSETYLAIINNEIVGFISMAESFLPALFIRNNMQRMGIGKELLKYVKGQRETIQLKVYKKNLNAFQFYLSQEFQNLSEETDKETNEIKILMEWNK